MKTIEVSDEQYQALAKAHGDVTAFVQRLAAEAEEVAAVMQGVAAYERGDYRPLEEFGQELMERHGIDVPEA